MTEPFSFSGSLLRWFDMAGRKNLPWQKKITAYRVWVSEIMLQQTQVSTVIPYFEKFIQRFPDVKTLADSHIDEVLALWTGLGYYSRARNLHRTAGIICDEYNGKFPDAVEILETLPGIGRSTAGAIVSIAYKKPAVILDGNVKRVLARFHAIEGWPGDSVTAKKLWLHAAEHSPEMHPGKYSQAIMDLGATVCTRSKPQCHICPLQTHCQAFLTRQTSLYPGRKARKNMPEKSVQMLMICNADGELLLQQRPLSGLWGGLWCLPEIPVSEDAIAYCRQLVGQTPQQASVWPGWRHSFSHFHLDITPVQLTLSGNPCLTNAQGWQWLNPALSTSVGLPAPLVRLLRQLITADSRQ